MIEIKKFEFSISRRFLKGAWSDLNRVVTTEFNIPDHWNVFLVLKYPYFDMIYAHGECNFEISISDCSRVLKKGRGHILGPFIL